MAQYNMGIMYYNGRGVPKSLVQAHMWLNIAVSNGLDPEARDMIAQKMTPSQIKEAQNLARKWMARYGG